MYKVPSMKEISALPWNGYNVVSTFSGGGGNCLGYEMAGFHVVWANEFIEEAQNTYMINHPKTFLNKNDIREVSPEEVIEQSGIPFGEIDLFDGSPPCSAFSTCGSREKGWGKVKTYSDSEQRVDDLFFEYTRLLKGLQPKTFIAENVSGLVKGRAKGYFKIILSEMKNCGYSVHAKLLNAQWLGVPQSRERLIFIGVRKDLSERYGVEPVHPKPMSDKIPLREAFERLNNDPEEIEMLLEDAPKHNYYKILKKIPKNPKKPISGAAYANGSYFNLKRESMYQPCSTVCQMGGNFGLVGNCHPIYDRKFTIEELKRIVSVPDDFELTGTFSQQWERLGRMVPPIMMKHISESVRGILDKMR